MKLGFHTDAFNSAYWSFEKCLAWAQQNNLHYIECGLIDGVSWIHGLGYQPHVALYEDPVLLRRKMERYGVQFSQVDAAFPLSGEDGPLRGVPYVMKAIAWAAQIGCPCVDTTDGLHKPEGLSDQESMAIMKRSYQQIMQVAQAHEIIVNVEPHGYFTTNPEAMAEMLAFVDSPWPAHEHGYRQHVHRRARSGRVSAAVPSQNQPRAFEGCLGKPRPGRARRPDRHRRQPLRAGGGRQCRQYSPVSDPAQGPRLPRRA